MNIKEQKGMALMMVLIAVIMVSATAIAIFAGVKTQGNTTVTMVESKTALARAEDGLNIIMAAINADPANADAILNTGVNIPNGNAQFGGWAIAVTYDDITGQVRSTATRGRYSKTIIMNYNAGGPAGGLGSSPIDHEMFTAGTLDMRLKSGNPANAGKFEWRGASGSLYANEGITAKDVPDGVINVDFNSGTDIDYSWKDASSSDELNNINRKENQAKLKFPEIDWNKLRNEKMITTGPLDNRVQNENQLKRAIETKQGSGGWIFYEVPIGNGHDSIDIELDFTNFNINIPENGQPLNIVFYRPDDEGKPRLYDINLSTTGGTNINGGAGLNIISHSGSLNFKNFHMDNYNGVIYTDYAELNPDGTVSDESKGLQFDRNFETNFKIGGVISKGNVDLTNVNYEMTSVKERDPNKSPANKWDFVATYMDIDIGGMGANGAGTFSNWREL